MTDGTGPVEDDDPSRGMWALAERLCPMPRSLTGDGVRATLAAVAELIPLEVHEVPSGTRVFDWVVPDEWNLRRAWLDDPAGRRVADTTDSNLHVVGYSTPVRRTMPLAELRAHLHSLPERPDWVPYRTSYYTPDWGFCLRHRDLVALPDGEYDVCIDAALEPGSLTYGECVLPGASTDEVLVSTHVCHPAMANDNLSGIAVATFLARRVARAPRRYTYRFLFIPGTIGSLAWLARNEQVVPRVRHGIVLAGVGDAGPLTWKRSRRGDTEVDQVAGYVLAARGPHRVVDFTPYGYDERQFCSPGFDLPVGRLSRTPHGEYPEYHTSADDMTFLSRAAMTDSLGACTDIVTVLEQNQLYVNTQPNGEPQLGRRGLYGAIGARGVDHAELALLWVLNQADGRHTLLDVAQRSGLPFAAVVAASEALAEHGLLAPAQATGGAAP